MLRSVARWPCLLLLLLVAADCKPPRPYRSRSRAKMAQSAKPSEPVIAAPSAALTPTPPSPLGAVGSAQGGPHKAKSALERREACEFKQGAMPEQTLDSEDPIGQRIPIDHFVIVMQENRSFDHYFHELPKYGQPDVDVTPTGYSNPDPHGKDVLPYH